MIISQRMNALLLGTALLLTTASGLNAAEIKMEMPKASAAKPLATQLTQCQAALAHVHRELTTAQHVIKVQHDAIQGILAEIHQQSALAV